MKMSIRWSLWGVCLALWSGFASAAEPPVEPASPPAPAVQPPPPAAAPSPDNPPPRPVGPEANLQAPFILQPGPADPQQEKVESNELETGLLLVQEKNYAEAVPLLERALKADPRFEPTWEALGWSYYYTGRAADAERLWQQYLTLRPDSPKAHSLLAQLAMLRSDWRATDTYLQGSLRLDPKNYDLRYWYAQNLYRLGRLDPAMKVLEELSREDEQRLDVRIDLARVYTLVQRYEGACDLWTEIVDAIPDNLDFRSEYARALMLVGSLEESDEQCRMILDQDPARWDMMNMRADIAEMSMQPERMIETLQDLIDHADDDVVRAKLHMRLGNRYVRLNEKDAERWPLTLALDEYENALDAVPDNVAWLNLYAQVALKAQQPLTARRLTNRILDELNPNNYQALRSRFELELMERNYDAAERALQDIYGVFQPNNPYRYLDLARLEVQRGRYVAAMDALDALEEEGNRGAVLTLLYHGLTESDWMALTSTRRLREHLMALQREGFTFITPADIPEYLQKNARVIEGPDPKPWLARQVDNVRYAFTGQPKSVRKLEDIRPVKVAAVTFDDGLRSSFSLGTPVAQELGLTFGMFVITGLEEINAPMYASWEEIRDYRATGAWQIGSHLLHSNTDLPLTSDTNKVGRTLPNRIWLPERKRLETLREWSVRIRREFAESRARIEQHLGLPKGEPMMVAYPYSDIGQEESSNVARIVNPIRSILTEADREYQAGFVMDDLGYTMPVDNKLQIRRHEPNWNEEATEVVEHVLGNHPVFLARRMRCEIATLMGKPHLAEKQIDLLRRDGYPDRLLRELVAYTQNRAPGARATQTDQALREGTSQNRIRPSNLNVGVSYRQNQSNEEIEQNIYELRGGLNLSERVGLEVFLRSGTIDQTVTSNIWFKTKSSETQSSQETRTETVNGVTTVSQLDVQTISTREIQTNRVQKTKYSADMQEIRGAMSFQAVSTASLYGSVGTKSLSFKKAEAGAADTQEFVGSLAVAWQRLRGLRMVFAFDRDLIPSARKSIVYHGISLDSRWKVTDDWDLNLNGRYMNINDNNAMVQVFGSSYWQLLERQGIWGGLEASTYSMDEDSDYYWSPYWDTRMAAVASLRQAYLNYFFQFDLRLGRQKEMARPEEKNQWLNLKAQAESDGNWDPGAGPDAPWDTFIGLGINYRQRLGEHLDVIGNIYVNFLRDYSEHDFTVGLQYNF